MKAAALGLFVLGATVLPGLAHDVGPFTDAEAEDALYRATALSRVIPECATISGRTPRRERDCLAAKEAAREAFQLEVEACNEGGQLPDVNVPIPASYVCTVNLRATETAPRRGGVVIFFFAADEWNAIVP